jgi:hypothetical protein
VTARGWGRTTEKVSDYVFGDAVRLRVRGPAGMLRHFDAEFGEATAAPGAEPDVDVRMGVGLRVERPAGGAVTVGGHKTARWHVALGPPDVRPLQARIALAGGPSWFALSLVQGYIVESLVALALAGTGRVALPGAAFVHQSGATVLLGGSGAGKTTVTARALAAGRAVLSDDQVVIDRAGGAWRYPRRLRLYPDIRETAPDAWSRLPEETRSTLALRGRVRRLTRGYVAPSLAVPPSDIGATVERGPVPLSRLLVVERAGCDELAVTARTPEWVIDQAAPLLVQQRKQLARALGGAWSQTLSAALQEERRTLGTALAGVACTGIVVPRAWEAPRAVAALEDAVFFNPLPARAPGELPPVSAR